MLNQFSRTELLIKKDGVSKLQNSKVAIFGIGGVGSFVVEGLVRAGVGNFVIVDDDKVCLTNLNRQIIATRKTIGKYKVDVMEERILEINPDAKVETYKEFYMPNSETNIITNDLDYVIDCVDTVTAKIEIIEQCKKLNVPVISAMGTGNKLDPLKFEITDIYKTSVCPLAKVMRKELRKRNIDSLKVIYSKEEPIKIDEYSNSSCKTNCICPPGTKRKCTVRNQVPGSISFVPSVAGLIIAGEVVKNIIGEC
ncbi:MAG: tRNA threonylcarbamoyladenosine dehydratase [Clostridia bacterium]|nr:tRNA threonylcarbamoyladenosine dehydratase [Clostridia bacterium]